MSKTLTPFENHLKDVMSGYEAKYDASSWNSLQKSLSKGKLSSKSWVVAFVAALIVTSTGAVVIYKNRNTPAKATGSHSEARFSYLFSSEDVQNSNNDGSSSLENPNQELSVNISETETNAVGINKNIDAGNASVNTQATAIDSNTNSTSGNSVVNTFDSDVNNKAGKNEGDGSTQETAAPSAITFKSDIREACTGFEIDFQVNGPTNGSYLWNFGDGHYSNEVNPKHKFIKPGSYDVSLSITDAQGHITVRTMPDMVTIHPSPDASFEWDFVNEIPNSPAVKIKNTSEYAQDYVWKFGDGTSSNQISPVMAFDKKGKHTVALEVTNEYGCSDATVKHISVNADMLGAQNGIVPGKDVFMPTSLKQNKTKFVMEIYTNDGKKVYETNNRNKGWDGILPDGSKAKEGDTYQWKVLITSDITHDEKYYNGTLSINP